MNTKILITISIFFPTLFKTTNSNIQTVVWILAPYIITGFVSNQILLLFCRKHIEETHKNVKNIYLILL